MIEKEDKEEKKPNVNMLYLMGYIGTLLLGSIHFGKILRII